MSYKKLNNTNSNFTLTAKDNKDERQQMLFDNVEALKQGEYVVCLNWEQVDDILTCFDDNEDWEIEESDGAFFVLPNNTTAQQKNKFKKAVRGA